MSIPLKFPFLGIYKPENIKSAHCWEPFYANSRFIVKVLLTFLHLRSPNLIENDHNFVFFDYKVWTQQHFESRLFWKNAEKLRICALFIFSDYRNWVNVSISHQRPSSKVLKALLTISSYQWLMTKSIWLFWYFVIYSGFNCCWNLIEAGLLKYVLPT